MPADERRADNTRPRERVSHRAAAGRGVGPWRVARRGVYTVLTAKACMSATQNRLHHACRTVGAVDGRRDAEIVTVFDCMVHLRRTVRFVVWT